LLFSLSERLNVYAYPKIQVDFTKDSAAATHEVLLCELLFHFETFFFHAMFRQRVNFMLHGNSALMMATSFVQFFTFGK
jgi:hypothetical protein